MALLICKAKVKLYKGDYFHKWPDITCFLRTLEAVACFHRLLEIMMATLNSCYKYFIFTCEDKPLIS